MAHLIPHLDKDMKQDFNIIKRPRLPDLHNKSQLPFNLTQFLLFFPINVFSKVLINLQLSTQIY